MPPEPDQVFYDAGDVLVTSRRAAYQSDSLSLDGVTAARVEPVDVRQTNIDRGEHGGWAALGVMLLAVAASGIYAWFRPIGSPWSLRSPDLSVLWIGMGLAVATLLAVVLLAFGRPAVRRTTTRWYAVRLAGDGPAAELFRTRDEPWAAEVAAAINRAVAGG